MPLLDTFIDRVESLPPAPRILPELLGLLSRDKADSGRVAEIIAFDPALTARVLQVANSAFFRGAEPVGDLPGAILRLGFSQVYQVVASVLGEHTFSAAQAGYGIAQGELWRHASVAAMAGKVIAREAGIGEELLFTAALLHDLGKLALGSAIEHSYSEVVDLTEKASYSFQEAEKIILGADHAEVGARLTERWDFPENLVAAVRWHHQPEKAQAGRVMAAGAHLADVLAHLLGHGYGHHAYALRARPEALDLLEISPQEVEALVFRTQAAVDDFQLFKPV